MCTSKGSSVLFKTYIIHEMTNKKERIINFQNFVDEIRSIEGSELCHMDPYYKKIDLHFGEYKETNKRISGDYSLYISGFWEVLDSGETILDESFSQEKVTDFFHDQIGKTVSSISSFEQSSEIFIEFSSGCCLHLQKDESGRRIELLKRNGDLIFPRNDGKYCRKTSSE